MSKLFKKETIVIVGDGGEHIIEKTAVSGESALELAKEYAEEIGLINSMFDEGNENDDDNDDSDYNDIIDGNGITASIEFDDIDSYGSNGYIVFDLITNSVDEMKKEILSKLDSDESIANIYVNL